MKKSTIALISALVLSGLLILLVQLTKSGGPDASLQPVLTRIEAYKKRHHRYPDSLAQAGIHWGKFFYRVDNPKERFTLSYSTGLMDENVRTYDSRTKAWTSQFSF